LRRLAVPGGTSAIQSCSAENRSKTTCVPVGDQSKGRKSAMSGARSPAKYALLLSGRATSTSETAGAAGCAASPRTFPAPSKRMSAE
jgi:hypothetical protein